MRLSLLSALVVMAILWPASGLFAANVPGDPCQTLGATTMSANHDGIIACVFPSQNSATSCESGGCFWKQMALSPNPVLQRQRRGLAV